MLLHVSAAMAGSLESELLRQWKQRMVVEIGVRYPAIAERFERQDLDDWVRRAMEAARAIGAIEFDDLRCFVVTLFDVAEAKQDAAATRDFGLTMANGESFQAKRAMLCKAFGAS